MGYYLSCIFQVSQMLYVVSGEIFKISQQKCLYIGKFIPHSFLCSSVGPGFTVKPVLNGHSKIDKTKVFKTNNSFMKVESIAECSLGAFCNTFDLH